MWPLLAVVRTVAPRVVYVLVLPLAIGVGYAGVKLEVRAGGRRMHDCRCASLFSFIIISFSIHSMLQLT